MKIIAQIATIAGEPAVCVDLHVRADQKIDDDATALASASQICRKGFAGQQRALARGGHEPELPIREKFVELFGGFERADESRPARIRR